MTDGHLVTRRRLLQASLLAPLVGLFGTEQARAESGSAASNAAKRVLVCVFLRGAADGLSLVVPYTDPDYYQARPTIAVARPSAAGGALDLDGQFGLHPRLAPLKAAYDAGELALVHAVGSPHPTRSHFQAQDYMETGAVGELLAGQGWLARYLVQRPPALPGQLRSIGLSARAPLALRGDPEAVVAASLGEFRLRASANLEPVLRQGFRKLYGAPSLQPATRAGQKALAIGELLARLNAAKYTPENGARYQRDASAFVDIARLIKADVGLEAAWLDASGWDTHRRQGNSERGTLATLLARLGRALAAFRADLGARFENVVVVVMSEFGRRVHENAARLC